MQKHESWSTTETWDSYEMLALGPIVNQYYIWQMWYGNAKILNDQKKSKAN